MFLLTDTNFEGIQVDGGKVDRSRLMQISYVTFCNRQMKYLNKNIKILNRVARKIKFIYSKRHHHFILR